jgi:hypothetical protein
MGQKVWRALFIAVVSAKSLIELLSSANKACLALYKRLFGKLE